MPPMDVTETDDAQAVKTEGRAKVGAELGQSVLTVTLRAGAQTHPKAHTR